MSRKFDKKMFWTEYIVRAITHPKVGDKLLNMFFLFLKDKSTNILSILKEIRADIENINRIDPISKRRYPELLCYVQGEEMLPKIEFDRLIVENYKKLAVELLKKWKEEGDERLQIVLSKNEIAEL